MKDFKNQSEINFKNNRIKIIERYLINAINNLQTTDHQLDLRLFIFYLGCALRCLRATKNRNYSLIADVLFCIGTIYNKLEFYEHSLDYLNRSIEMRKNILDNNISSVVNSNYYLNIEPIEVLEESNKNDAIVNLELRASFLNFIGMLFYHNGEYSISIKYYKESLKLLTDLNKRISSIKAELLSNIGISYLRTAEFNKSINYLKFSLSVYKNLNTESHKDDVIKINQLIQIITGLLKR